MTAEKVILITGAAGPWGTRLAQRFAGEPDTHVMALDVRPPSPGLAGLDYIQADYQEPLMGELLAADGVHTVCHLDSPAIEKSGKSNGQSFSRTARFLEVCAQAGVQQVVMMSTTGVYGAQPENPILFSESHPLASGHRTGWLQDLLEIESYANGFARQHPEMAITILRFANIVGPFVGTPMTRYLRGPAAPTLLGFNPVMQLIHEQDVLSALAHVVMMEIGGTFNVAAEPTMPLKRLLALAGTLPVPVFHPLAYRSRPVREQMIFPPDYLRYRWVADTAKMQNEMGFFPEKSAEEAVLDFRAAKEELRHAEHPRNGAGTGYILPLAEVIARRQKEAAYRQAATASPAVDPPFVPEEEAER